jgi:hypothetical protein
MSEYLIFPVQIRNKNVFNVTQTPYTCLTNTSLFPTIAHSLFSVQIHASGTDLGYLHVSPNLSVNVKHVYMIHISIIQMQVEVQFYYNF